MSLAKAPITHVNGEILFQFMRTLQRELNTSANAMLSLSVENPRFGPRLPPFCALSIKMLSAFPTMPERARAGMLFPQAITATNFSLLKLKGSEIQQEDLTYNPYMIALGTVMKDTKNRMET